MAGRTAACTAATVVARQPPSNRFLSPCSPRCRRCARRRGRCALRCWLRRRTRCVPRCAQISALLHPSTLPARTRRRPRHRPAALPTTGPTSDTRPIAGCGGRRGLAGAPPWLFVVLPVCALCVLLAVTRAAGSCASPDVAHSSLSSHSQLQPPAPAHPRGCCSPVRHRSSQSGISLHPHPLSLIPGLSRSPSTPARNGASSVPRTLPCMSSRLCWPCSPERLQQRTLPRPSPPSRPGKSFSRRLTRLSARLPTPAVCRQALPLHSTTTALNDLTNLLRPSLPPAPSARSPSPLLRRHRPSCGWPSRGCS